MKWLWFCLVLLGVNGIFAQELAPLPRLKQLTKESPVLIIVLSTTCPICQKYAGMLPELSQQYPFVRFVGIFTKWETAAEIQQFANDYNLNFSLYLDKKHRLLRQLKATTTPEVFLMDRNGNVQYQGAIDNWFYGLGKYRTTAIEHYLTEALDAFLNGKEIVNKKTKSIGCEIGK